MNICILIPSEDHSVQAGVRIRYRRIEQVLRARGHQLDIAPIQSLKSAGDLVHHVYVASKCYDARMLVLGQLLHQRGKLLGVDLFDDYFSQGTDSRLTGQRYWLQTFLRLADFALCSTPVMRDVVRGLSPDLPTHVMRDPASEADPGEIRLALQRKSEYVARKRIINVGWFGIGDNPVFPVGLADLVAFSPDLHRMRGQGFDIRLDILTNHRAMRADGLAMLRRLALPYTVEEWTEKRERTFLAKTLVCHLPVNRQSFSVAKSLNRALSALCAGAQVLSSGYPLYEALAPLIYRDTGSLLDDIRRGTLALRGDTVGDLMRLVNQTGDPVAEARSLLQFLENQLESKLTTTPSALRENAVAIIHGRDTTADVHKLGQRLGALSVGSPFSTADLNFDVRFSLSSDATGVDVLIADKWCSRLGRDLQACLFPYGKLLDTAYQRIDASQVLPGIQFDVMALARMGSPMSITASYPHVMTAITRMLQRLFPGISCYHAEHAELPWHVFSHPTADSEAPH